jgi:glycosyltransferase involved in cell wall biosynthesis
MRFSVITATYNRRTLLQRALKSALEFVRIVGDSEIVVVDDASQDGTVDMIRTVYATELKSALLKLVERRVNGGSTAAKSDGAKRAGGDWLIFLDSDDELLPEAATFIPDFIDAHSDAKLFFFRCVDQDNHPIGPQKPPTRLSFAGLLNAGTPGECLPVTSRSAFLEYPSDNDPLAYEFMALLRIARANGYAMLSDSIVRRYHTEGADRLTSIAGNLRRARRHAEGFKRMLREFGPAMSPGQRRKILIRIFCYRAIAACGISRVI